MNITEWVVRHRDIKPNFEFAKNYFALEQVVAISRLAWYSTMLFHHTKQLPTGRDHLFQHAHYHCDCLCQRSSFSSCPLSSLWLSLPDDQGWRGTTEAELSRLRRRGLWVPLWGLLLRGLQGLLQEDHPRWPSDWDRDDNNWYEDDCAQLPQEILSTLVPCQTRAR